MYLESVYDIDYCVSVTNTNKKTIIIHREE